MSDPSSAQGQSGRGEAQSLSRLFVALVPPPAVCHAIAAQRADWRWPAGARLTRPERLHLTLHFLGDVDAARVPGLREALARVSGPALELRLQTPEVWRHNGVAVLRCAPDAGLDALHRDLLEALSRQGLARVGERWTPHLTIARRAEEAQPPAAMAPIGWTAREFVLVRSHLTAPVFRYEPLARYPLRAPC